jgi:hypothetical protein
MAEHLPEDTSLSVVAVNPGLCHSGLFRYEGGARQIAFNVLLRLAGRTVEMGSRAIVWGALGGDNKLVNGKYLDSCRVQEEDNWVLGKDGRRMQDNAWVSKANCENPFIDDLIMFRM